MQFLEAFPLADIGLRLAVTVFNVKIKAIKFIERRVHDNVIKLWLGKSVDMFHN